MDDRISINGAVDIHLHSYPSLFSPRIGDDRDIAEAAAKAGMGAILLKCHFESTVSRAYIVQKDFAEMKVFGGVVLNSYVGGINPGVVEAALWLGGKEVWMPSMDSAAHVEVHGSTGNYGIQKVEIRHPEKGISVMQENGKLTPETIEVLELIAKYDAILGTSHLSLPEIRLLVSEARSRGVKKILLTHPFFNPPVGAEKLDFLEEMVSLGVIPEFTYYNIAPMAANVTLDKMKELIRKLGAGNCILASDCGQIYNPMPHEALRIYAQSLYQKGLPYGDVEKLIKTNPRNILGL